MRRRAATPILLLSAGPAAPELAKLRTAAVAATPDPDDDGLSATVAISPSGFTGPSDFVAPCSFAAPSAPRAH